MFFPGTYVFFIIVIMFLKRDMLFYLLLKYKGNIPKCHTCTNMPIRVFLFHSNGTFKASDSLQHHADVFTQDMMEADANSEG